MKLPKVRKLPSGMYNCQLRINGQSISITEKTEKLVMAKAAAIKGGLIKEQKSGTTVKKAVHKYIDERNNILSPSTIREYVRISNALGTIGEKQIKDIKTNDLQLFVNELSKKHSPKTVKNIFMLVNSAIKNECPNINCTVSLPQKDNLKTRIPNENEMALIIKATKNTPLEIPILLAAFGSLRRSEICALTSDDVTEFGVIINKALVQNSKKEWVIKRPKTTESAREAALPEFVIDKLKQIDGDITTLNPDNISHRFSRMLRKLGIEPFRFHDLRHYWVSIAVALNMPLEYIVHNGGWSTIDTPRKVYMHIVDDENKRKNNELNNYFKSKFANENANKILKA